MTAFFARRSTDPETVADLTSETFVRAIGSFATFDPRRGSAGAWLFGIARRVYAQHRAAAVGDRAAIALLATRRVISDDELEELSARIDAERRARELLSELDGVPAAERAAFELVELVGLENRDAAAVLRVSAGTLRVRLFRARKRLRQKEVSE